MQAKNCSNISENLLYCSLSYPSTYIGTPNFFVKILWFYNDLKYFFFRPKVTKLLLDSQDFIENRSKVV